jgi:tetratricopeptide (TPR) repeat protein
MNSLAQLYVTMERLDDAEPLWREIRELTLRIHGPSHPYTMAAIHGLSRVRRMQGNPQEALELSTEVVGLARDHLPPGHWYLGSFLTNYGKCLAAMGRDEEASAALEEAYGIYKDKFGGEHERTQEIIRLLVQHHEDYGRSENAQRFEKLIVSGP